MSVIYCVCVAPTLIPVAVSRKPVLKFEDVFLSFKQLQIKNDNSTKTCNADIRFAQISASIYYIVTYIVGQLTHTDVM